MAKVPTQTLQRNMEGRHSTGMCNLLIVVDCVHQQTHTFSQVT